MKTRNQARLKTEAETEGRATERSLDGMVQRHVRVGWMALLVFLALGLVLEGLHAFKAGGYLNPSHSTRRLMWTLAHAHGTLLGLMNIALAVTVLAMGRKVPVEPPVWTRISLLMSGATVLLPGGFFLGGLSFHGGDPGLGIVLVPIGALMLLAAVGMVVRQMRRGG